MLFFAMYSPPLFKIFRRHGIECYVLGEVFRAASDNDCYSTALTPLSNLLRQLKNSCFVGRRCERDLAQNLSNNGVCRN